MNVENLFSLPLGRLLKRTAAVGVALTLAGCVNSPADKTPAPVMPAAGKPAAPRQTIRVQTWFIEMKTDKPTARSLVATLKEKTGMKKIGGNTGILSAAQAKVIWAELKAPGQVDILSAPVISLASGNQGRITIGEEMRYPRNWEWNATNKEWTPTHFDTRLIGVESEVAAHLRDDGGIGLDLRATATELDGFVATDTPGSPAGTVPADAVTLGGKSLNIDSPATPVFSTRNVKTQISLRPGETLVLQGASRKTTRAGDAATEPKKNQAEDKDTRESFIFVTATLEAPAGPQPAP